MEQTYSLQLEESGSPHAGVDVEWRECLSEWGGGGGGGLLQYPMSSSCFGSSLGQQWKLEENGWPKKFWRRVYPMWPLRRILRGLTNWGRDPVTLDLYHLVLKVFSLFSLVQYKVFVAPCWWSPVLHPNLHFPLLLFEPQFAWFKIIIMQKHFSTTLPTPSVVIMKTFSNYCNVRTCKQAFFFPILWNLVIWWLQQDPWRCQQNATSGYSSHGNTWQGKQTYSCLD